MKSSVKVLLKKRCCINKIWSLLHTEVCTAVSCLSPGLLLLCQLGCLALLRFFCGNIKKKLRYLVTPPVMLFTCCFATNAKQVVFICQTGYTSVWFTAESRILTKCYTYSSVWLKNISNSNSLGLDLMWLTTVELHWTVFCEMTHSKVLK